MGKKLWYDQNWLSVVKEKRVLHATSFRLFLSRAPTSRKMYSEKLTPGFFADSTLAFTLPYK